jgi:hypothetical protein
VTALPETVEIRRDLVEEALVLLGELRDRERAAFGFDNQDTVRCIAALRAGLVTVVAGGPAHGVECFEAWRDGKDCTHERVEDEQ